MGLCAKPRPGLRSGAQSRHICHRVLNERMTPGGGGGMRGSDRGGEERGHMGRKSCMLTAVTHVKETVIMSQSVVTAVGGNDSSFTLMSCH